MNKADETRNEIEFSKRIGERIRYFRADRKMSLSQLSSQSGVAKGTLSKLETGEGNPTILTLGALARVLHITPGDFITPETNKLSMTPSETELQGPGIHMTFLYSISGATLWNLYNCYVPYFDEPLISPTHPGIEHIVIMDGAIKIGPVDNPVILETGGHSTFKGSEPHMYAPIDGPCRMLLMMEYPKIP
jgi:transcriptional regulator with XRE-family HTH domain